MNVQIGLMLDQTGKNTGKRSISAVNAMATPITIRGLILRPLSSSVSKYLINPAEGAKPPSFFFAIKTTTENPYK